MTGQRDRLQAMPGGKGDCMRETNDFSKGSVIKKILKLALPRTLAQLINVL